MRLFDTQVQKNKYRVLKKVAKLAFEDRLNEAYYTIPKEISPGPKPVMRCCVFKERAITTERINMAMGGDLNNRCSDGSVNVIQVIDIACDECPIEKYVVTEACRGCISHQCMTNCPKGAVTKVNGKAYIDHSLCIECGKCKDSCPYGAIIETTRPCIKSCKVGALSIDENKKAKIDNDKCVMCGACVYNCPFGAITDISYILDVVDLIKKARENPDKKLYAIIAPAIVSQFPYAKIGQLVSGIKKIGFHHVVEVALGADIVLYKEKEEFKEKDILTTSCCPSFVMYIERHFPELAKYISHTPSPMIESARLLKKTDPNASIVFIGPCTSKKHEFTLEKAGGVIDSVITFEELQALLDSLDIKVEDLEEDVLDNASFYGRIFAKSGGITQGINDLLKEENYQGEVKPAILNGLDECKPALMKLKFKRLEANFLEGMACKGGCINGAGCLHHGDKNAKDVDAYANSSKEKTVDNSLKLYNLTNNE